MCQHRVMKLVGGLAFVMYLISATSPCLLLLPLIYSYSLLHMKQNVKTCGLQIKRWIYFRLNWVEMSGRLPMSCLFLFTCFKCEPLAHSPQSHFISDVGSAYFGIECNYNILLS